LTDPRLYSLYGQACGVGFDWPWCPPAGTAREIELRIELGSLGRFDGHPRADYVPYRQRAGRDHAQRPIVLIERGGDGHFRVAYADGAEFVIDATASEIFGVSRSDLTLDDLLVYLQGPILGFVLRLRGITCLHASAATLEGRAFAIVGGAGMGKSTSAAALARLGLDVLTDDVLALRDGGASFDVQPGLPRVLLWPESVTALFGDPEALPRVVSTWDKRYLDLTLPGYRFAQQAAPLGAIYVLGERLPAGDPPQITELEGSSALFHLIANTYANDFLDASLRARELEALGRVVRHVPVRLLRAPHDRRAVSRVCEAVVADLRARS
jgi:hypothetical protein